MGAGGPYLAHFALVSTEWVTQLAVGDPSSTRTVYAVIIALGCVGLALLILGIWLMKQTKPDLELLAPLERMDDRSWRRQDPAQQRRTLDEVRPAGASPVDPSQDVPEVDDDFRRSKPAPANFDDLRDQLEADARGHPLPADAPPPTVLPPPKADGDDTGEFDNDPVGIARPSTEAIIDASGEQRSD
jgi:hypothetical protein